MRGLNGHEACMPWLQLRIQTDRNRVSNIETAMQTHGALSVTFEDNADEPIFEPDLGETPLWSETRVTGLFEANIDTKSTLEKILGDCEAPSKACRWEILEDKDWQREWMKYFEPLKCGENFWICPSWTSPPDPDATNLMLDPGLAFGTGTHPTTFLCLNWIAESNFHGKTVVDYGCGSGILGIAALLCGADSVKGTDIDPQALTATKNNVLNNKLDPNGFPVFLPEHLPPNTTVDFVFANILAGPLVELAPTLVPLLKPNGKICLSGILDSQSDAVIEAYAEDILIENVTKKDNWVCITGSRKSVTQKS